ncbi:hypothetical protein FBEOM_8841 [Fusarium beomiforme]|uniref:CBM-cenC domain-containing protein n=1 Tax=Fusarium beomiforme TaxID=44412 RepID=A0A9P5AFY1_9HYPO|nr:hypothetical protein FBEOM_8841 [Fusarium beomiforme]
MRSITFALRLLALGCGVLASPCLPHPPTSLTISTVATLSTESTESTTVLTTTTASDSEPTTTLSIDPTESSSELTTASAIESTAIVSIASTESISESTTTAVSESTASTESNPVSTTASAESTTVFIPASTTSEAVQSTTTAAAAEPQEPNLLVNSGFEDGSVDPWKLFRPTANQGQISIARDQFYEGSQSGHFQHGASSSVVFWGMYQSVDASSLVAQNSYQITLRIRVAPGTCSSIAVGAVYSNNVRITGGMVTVDVAAASIDWIKVTTVVQYSQAALNGGPGIAIMSTCTAGASFWVDDVALRNYIEPTP